MNGTSRFEENFQMGLRCLLESKDRLTTVASMRVAPGEQCGLGNPDAVLVSARFDFGRRKGRDAETVHVSASAVNEASSIALCASESGAKAPHSKRCRAVRERI
jgi:hypothetical protein